VLSDRDYEHLLLQMVDRVAQGWEQAQMVEHYGQRLQDRFFKSWLQRFGEKLVRSAVPNRELAERLVRLGEMGCGEIGRLALAIGRQVLMREVVVEPES
jgi:hypothetical protein